MRVYIAGPVDNLKNYDLLYGIVLYQFQEAISMFRDRLKTVSRRLREEITW